MSQVEPSEPGEIDFSGGTRGKFFRGGATHVPPVHLATDVLSALQKRALESGVALETLVNAMLREDLQLPAQ